MQNAPADLREGQDGGESGETRNNGKSGELSGPVGGEAPAQRPEMNGLAPDRAETNIPASGNQAEVRAGDQQAEARSSSEGD